ncbi:MAG TPA: hypothetical protein VNT22_09635, partial [Baekduia sp.]|nr:hypothetical protein [Baekduia sp.]
EYDDVRGAVKLYGGKARMSKFATPPLCPIYPDPPAPTIVEASDAVTPGDIKVRFVRPADAAIPPYLLPEARTNGGYAIAAQAGAACPDLTAARRQAWSVAAGAEEQPETVRGLQPGPNCVAVWAIDVMGRPSAPATTSVTVL